jgi:hypothetical protein
MQPSKLKVLGIVLLLVAVIAALVFQVTGFGLVTYSVSNPSSVQTTTSQGFTVTTMQTNSTFIHLKRVAPFAVLAIAGLVCLAMGYRNQLSEIE